MYVRRAVACKTVMFTAAELGTNGRGVRCSKNGETMSAGDSTRYLPLKSRQYNIFRYLYCISASSGLYCRLARDGSFMESVH